MPTAKSAVVLIGDQDARADLILDNKSASLCSISLDTRTMLAF